MKAIYSIIALCSVLMVSCGGEKNTISLQLEEGETYSYYVQAIVDIEQEVTGMTMKQYIDISSHINYKVVEIVEDAYKLQVSYEHIKMLMDLGVGQTIEVDSDLPDPSNPTSAVLEHLKDQTFFIVVSKTGQIKSFEGLEEFGDKIIEAANIKDNLVEAQMRQFIEQTYSETALRAAYEPMFNFYPETEVKEGNTWKKEAEGVNVMGSIEDLEYTLALEKSDSYHISGHGLMIPNKDPEPVAIGGNEIVYHVEGEINSSFEIDHKTGWVNLGQIEQNAEGINEVSISALGQTMEIPMVFHSVIKFSKDKIED